MEWTRSVVVRPRRGWRRLIDIRRVQIVQAANINVTNIYDHSRPDLSLDVQGCLIDSLILPVVVGAADDRTMRNNKFSRRVVLGVCQGQTVLGELQGRSEAVRCEKTSLCVVGISQPEDRHRAGPVRHPIRNAIAGTNAGPSMVRGPSQTYTGPPVVFVKAEPWTSIVRCGDHQLIGSGVPVGFPIGPCDRPGG